MAGAKCNHTANVRRSESHKFVRQVLPMLTQASARCEPSLDMKVMLLSRYSPMGASSRVRHYQYLPYLRELGVEVSVAWLLDDNYLIRRHAGQARHPQRIIGAYLRRALGLFSAGSFDLLWIEGELFPWLPAWGEALLSRCGIPYVAEYDDAWFHRYDEHDSPLVRRLLGDKINQVMRNAALVIAGNDYLCDHARVAGARAAFPLPSAVDLERYHCAPRRPGQPFTIGWIGSPSTAEFLKQLVPVLARMRAEFDCRIVCIGAGDLVSSWLPAEVRPWLEDTEVEEIQTFDVGISPLNDTPWARGKCGYKIIQYMACGTPVVASRVGMNEEIIRHGTNGFLAETEKDWICCIRALRDDLALRERIGQAGRRLVAERYCLQVTAPKLLALLRQAAGSPGAWRRSGK